MQARVDHFQGPINDGQGAQAEKVKLNQPRILHIILVVLGDQSLTVFITVERRKITEFGGRNHHATGMLADVTGNTLQFQAHLPNFAGILIVFQKLPQVFLLIVGLVQGHPHFEGDQLGEFVRHAVGFAQNTGNILNHPFSRHSAEGDDLGHRLTAISLADVINHLVAVFHAEIHVKVWHRNPLRVEKTFEQQIVLQRIKISDLLGISHQ